MPTDGAPFVQDAGTTGELVGEIIIPAHNEEAVIGRSLDVLDPHALGTGVRVIVACNGCDDRTALIARERGVRVLEVAKTPAIRAAESECRPVPRIYLDADVELANAAARSLLQHLSADCPAARPPIMYASENCPWSVRHYYRARRAIPSVMNRLWGAGVYGLSSAGRSRFGDYPDVIAEDYWVDLHFSDAEISILKDCPPVLVHAPRRASDLRAVLRRTYRGPSLVRGQIGASPSSGTTGRELLAYAKRGPGPLMDAAIYSVFALDARIAAGRRQHIWERDESTRGPQ